MTGEEMERAIEFLLKNQASFESGLVELKEQIGETNKLLQMHAETQTQLIQTVIRNAEEQRQFNAEFRAELRALSAGLRALSEAQARTDEQLKRTDENLKRTDEQLKRTNEQLNRTDENLKRTDEQLNRTDGQLKRTDENLNRLAATVQSLVEGRG